MIQKIVGKPYKVKKMERKVMKIRKMSRPM